jgi:hypothetical protein
MKRHICAGAGALVLALAGAGTATAAGGCCGSAGQEGEQTASGGDQSVGEQSNDADVAQEQGNGNVNISPAIALGGDASTHNAQGNGNTAIAFVDQANAVDQSQDVSQTQSVASGGGGCCGASSQSAEQSVYGGDQSVDEQRNDADVTQEQGNGNLNRSPAIALGAVEHGGCGPCSKGKDGGDDSSASTWNAQGNGNKAIALVGQSNAADQSHAVTQLQKLVSDGCCDTGHTPSCSSLQKPELRCSGSSGQAGTQSVWGGDQSVGRQKNDADVTQEQGNGNENRSPAKAHGGETRDPCAPCEKGKSGGDSSASTWNAQGNGNTAVAGVQQGNTATQSQSIWQGQRLIDACKEVMRW